MAALLTTVIGLVGVYIAFALAASWVNEQIATLLQLRSKTLSAGIRSMIGDAAAADFFEHPLIVALGEAPAQNIWAKLGTPFGLKYRAQSVPAKVAPVSSADSLDAASVAAAPAAVRNPPYVGAEHFAMVLVDLLQNKAPGSSPLASLGASSADVAAAINAISVPGSPYKPLYEIVLPIWKNAKGDYDRFTDALGSWYDSQMDRVTGWYKRSVQVILIYIGLVIAAGLNVDTIQIVNDLQQNATLANALAGQTQAYVNAQEAANKAGNAGSTVAPVPARPCQSSSPCTCEDGYIAKNNVCEIDLSALAQLPLGWNLSRWRYVVPHPNAPLHEKLAEKGLWFKLFGLILTTVAILLGAPFWFDVLGAIVNVRSVGTKPPPSNAT